MSRKQVSSLRSLLDAVTTTGHRPATRCIASIGWWSFLPLITALISGFEYLPIALILWFILRKFITIGKRIIYYLLAIKIVATVIYFPVIIGLLFSHDPLFANYPSTIINVYRWLFTAGLEYNNLGLYLFNGISYVLLFSAIQALIICSLQRQEIRVIKNLPLTLTSRLASTPDISNYFQVRSIINKPFLRLNHLWEGNDYDNYPVELNYWVTIESDDSIVAVDLVNPVSQEFFPPYEHNHNNF